MSERNGSQTRPGRVGVLRVHREFRLISNDTIRPGEVLFTLEGVLSDRPTRYTVQLDHDVHLDTDPNHDLQEVLDRYYWRFMNHHCEPNVAIRGREVYALRRIRPREEISFNYNTTEYAMAEPFPCRCQSSSCTGMIQGFKYLSEEEQEKLRPYLAPHLIRLMEPEFTHAVVAASESPVRVKEGSLV